MVGLILQVLLMRWTSLDYHFLVMVFLLIKRVVSLYSVVDETHLLRRMFLLNLHYSPPKKRESLIRVICLLVSVACYRWDVMLDSLSQEIRNIQIQIQISHLPCKHPMKHVLFLYINIWAVHL